MTESGPRQNEPSSERKEEAQVVGESKKRGKYLPWEKRVMLYQEVNVLYFAHGLSINKVRDVIEQKHGIKLSKSQISFWIRGKHAPPGEWLPSLDYLAILPKERKPQGIKKQEKMQATTARKEEIQVNVDKKINLLSLDLRIILYEEAKALQRDGLSIRQISDIIYQKHGIRVSTRTLQNWIKEVYNPYRVRRIPSIDFLEPSEDLAYIIGVVCGDAAVTLYERTYNAYIKLEAKDREFVEEVAIHLGRVLMRPPPKVKFRRSTGHYYIQVSSKTLYELLKKPIELDRVKRFIEHCPSCKAMFLRGFFDSEGSITERGYVRVDNTDYQLLLYVQELLRGFGIQTSEIKLHRSKNKGSTFYDPRRGKVYTHKRDCYYLRIRANSNERFYRFVGLTILRKRARLENYLRK
jgi:intein-encoded DNA endonuclease-like protein